MKKRFVVLVVAILFYGCASVTTNLYKDAIIFSPTNPDKISVFRQKPQNTEFIEIGEITVSRVNKIENAEKELKKAAAKLGGDAVYIINQNSKSGAVIIPTYGGGFAGGMRTELMITGVVIKYKD